MRKLLLAGFFLLPCFSFAQNKDSLMNVQWESALKKLKSGDYSNEYEKAKAGFDEAVKARINTAELFEHRGHTR